MEGKGGERASLSPDPYRGFALGPHWGTSRSPGSSPLVKILGTRTSSSSSSSLMMPPCSTDSGHGHATTVLGVGARGWVVGLQFPCFVVKRSRSKQVFISDENLGTFASEVLDVDLTLSLPVVERRLSHTALLHIFSSVLCCRLHLPPALDFYLLLQISPRRQQHLPAVIFPSAVPSLHLGGA